MRKYFTCFPITQQLTHYSNSKFTADIIASIVVTMMLIPQSLAYAMLAGLPPHYGLYASILPIIVYALLGSSSTLSVGPVAIASIMTASALSSVVETGLISYLDGAITLAVLSGAILFFLGVARFGFIANFLSHSVVSGFITASALIIALSQLKHVFGVSIQGHSVYELLTALYQEIHRANLTTCAIGISALIFLVLARKYAWRLFILAGVSTEKASIFARLSPIVGVCISTLVVALMSLEQHVAIVGDIPTGVADFVWPNVSIEAIKALLVPAFFIAIIGYVESISVGRTLGAKREERVNPNQELIALGGANIASGVVGAFPVTGGFSRSVVNFDAGAQTQMASIFTAVGITLTSLFLTPFLYFLPIAMLAATIIVAVLSLLDMASLKQAWHFSKSDFWAAFTTIMLTLLFGVEVGVASGLIVSILLHLYQTSRPHIAEVGLIPNTQHFRNINHYQVEQQPHIVSLRIDESLLFSNACYLENFIEAMVNERPELAHVILHFGGVNTVDLTAMEMLAALNKWLEKKNILLHLSEVKMPVKNQLQKADFISTLTGQLYLTHLQAYQTLAGAKDL